MNDESQSLFGARTEPAAAADIEQLDHEVASVRSTISAMLSGLVMLSVAVNLFLWRQVRMVRTQLAEESAQVTRYQQSEPSVQELIRRLQAFGASHPDYQPIIKRYAPQQQTGTNKAGAPKK